MQEKTYHPRSGWLMLAIVLLMFLGGPALVIRGLIDSSWTSWQVAGAVTGGLISLASVVMFSGFQAVQPNESRVLLLFGKYHGTLRSSGFFWVNPFFSKKKISLRIRNFETGSTTHHEVKNAAGQVITPKTRSQGRPSKVNDRDGNPIDILAVVVWRVINTAEAMFEVDDFEDFVAVQSEAALRALASRHPYDCQDENISLRGSPDEISTQLRTDIQDRLDKAGVEVIEARISHLAYSQEIAAAMLQRQQAQAVVAARTKIVEGAVTMVQMALEQLAEHEIVELDAERKAAMVSNLLVVLCGDRHTQPVINTGSLY
jgi:regulator of protease activity HflC (stomatin/prohibitin superfamily)